MIYPPVYAVCAADSVVQSELGSAPCRLYLFGHADIRPAKPYAVWQVIGGSPGNYINQAPDTDAWALQIDVYGDTATAARDAAVALRNAIEPVAHVTAWRGEERDQNTKVYRVSFDVDWITSREITS